MPVVADRVHPCEGSAMSTWLRVRERMASMASAASTSEDRFDALRRQWTAASPGGRLGR